jgi:aryl-alcohol dehydrogenase
VKVTAALSHSDESPFSLESVELEEPRAEEILVRIHASGICHTDLTFKAQSHGPSVFGHEGAGVVEQVGDRLSGVRPGDHIVLSYRSCGACRQCLVGEPAYCSRTATLNLSGGRSDGSLTLSQNGARLFGGFFGQSSFAQYALTTADNAVVVDQSVDLALAAPLGCGFQTGAGAVFNVLNPQPDSQFTVFGTGSVGLAAVMAAKAVGVQCIVAVDPVAARRAKAVELGATRTVDPTTEDVKAAVRRTTHALDTTAKPQVIAAALASLRPRGQLVLVGLGAGLGTLDLDDLMLGGKVIRGCIEGDSNPHTFIPQLLDLHRQGLFPMESLVRTYPASDINQAVTDTRSGVTIKPVLLW